MSANTITSSSCCASFVKQFPLITAAVKQGSCEVDRDLLNTRIWKVVVLALSLILTSVIFPAAHIYLSIASLGALCVIPLDKWRTERAADQKAVTEYLNNTTPAISATDRIRNSPRAARWLVNQISQNHSGYPGSFLQRPNENNETLLADLRKVNFEVFKILISGLQKNFLPYEIKEELIKNRNPSYLEYVLKNKFYLGNLVRKYQKNEMTRFFTLFNNARTAQLLKEHGYDINARLYFGEEDSRTPLMLLAVRTDEPGTLHRVRTLLELGADTSLTVPGSFGRKYTAYDLCKDPELKKLLKPEEVKKD